MLLFVLGGLAMLPVTVDLLRLWRDDPLRSFGALLPFLSIVLIVRTWKTMNWPRNGSAWGLLPMGAAIMLARLFGTVLLAYRFRTFQLSPVQPGLLWFFFGSGVLILLGGVRLWRASLFPLCLLLCVNPVPHLFERLDFPLQVVSANTARNFARLLGLQPTGEQLQMMFAPRFGMVIVPGCNGVRGSATMVYLALLIGYLRRMGARRTALLMLAGLATGYLLNLTRLCVLVLYYWIGVHFPNLRGDGELIDYFIGGTLFLLVSFLAGMLLFRPLPGAASLARPQLRGLPPRLEWTSVFRSARWISATILLLITALTEAPSAFATAMQEKDDFIQPTRAAAQLPHAVGGWQSGKQWTEVYYDKPVWLWTHFTRPDGAALDFGLWLSPKRHFAIQSRMMNGSKPVLAAPFDIRDQRGTHLAFSTFTLQDDFAESSQSVPTFFAETICLPSHCSVQESGFQKTGWIVGITPVGLRTERRLPILYRVQSTPGGREDTATQAQARAWVTNFTAQMDVRKLVEELGTR